MALSQNTCQISDSSATRAFPIPVVASGSECAERNSFRPTDSRWLWQRSAGAFDSHNQKTEQSIQPSNQTNKHINTTKHQRTPCTHRQTNIKLHLLQRLTEPLFRECVAKILRPFVQERVVKGD